SATGLLMKNHSTTAPAIASSTRKNGKPSRRSDLSRFSCPKARKSPPVARARPCHARTGAAGRSGSPMCFLGAGADFAALPFEEPPRPDPEEFLGAVDDRAMGSTVRVTPDKRTQDAQKPG